MTMPAEPAVIVPALLTEPPTVLFLMVMPVVDGWPMPVAVRTPLPVLMTLPVTVALLCTLMQLPVGELLLTVATVPPVWVTLHGGGTASAGGAPPITRAATELVVSSSKRLLRARPLHAHI